MPTDESDQSWYVHLRLELAKDRSEDELTSQLPSFCEKTRKMPAPWDPLDKCETSAFRDGAVEWGWLILGEGSEWVLRMLESHDPNKRIPPLNVAQLLHYVGNSLLVTAVQIRMP